MTSAASEANREVIKFGVNLFQGQGSFVNYGSEQLNIGLSSAASVAPQRPIRSVFFDSIGFLPACV
jgi:hypothetical protein